MIFGRRLVRCSSLLAAGSFLRRRGTATAAIFTATVFRRAAVFLPCRQILVHFGKLAVGTTSSPGFHHRRRRRRDRFHGISSGIFSFPQNTPFFHTLHRSSQTNKISLPKLKWHPAGTTHFHTAVGHKPSLSQRAARTLPATAQVPKSDFAKQLLSNLSPASTDDYFSTRENKTSYVAESL